MRRNIGMAILALVLGGAVVLSLSPVSAQQGQQEEQKRKQGKSRGGGDARKSISKRDGSARTAPRNSAQRSFTRRKPQSADRRKNIPSRRRANTSRKAYTAQKNPGSNGASSAPRASKRVAVAGKIRGAGRAKIRGRNFSVWRGGHRFRHNNGWRTFAGLSVLGAIAIGSDEYYPYAYISASEPYCDGLTDDGCVLRWTEVQTVEGDVVDQCVAYCPWQ